MYDDIMKGTPVFSPDGKRVAYSARKGGRWFVVVDGQAGPEYDGIMAGTPVFSPDGKRLAYVPEKGGKWLVVVDGQEGPTYDMTGHLAFSRKTRVVGRHYRRYPTIEPKSRAHVH